MTHEDDELEIDLSEAIPLDQMTEDDQKAIRAEFDIEPPRPRVELSSEARKFLAGRLKTPNWVLSQPPPEWFIEEMIPLGPVTVLHGESGSKKSFLLLDWMMCAATGRAWHGMAIRPGRVLYIVAEGVSGMGKRLRAWLAANHMTEEDIKGKIWFLPEPINLFTVTDAAIDNWAAGVRKYGIDYIVVDTLHMSSFGASENDSKDMGIVFNKARQIASGASLFFAHHDPKAQPGAKRTPTARGSGSIRDDADVVLQVIPISNLLSKLKSEKLKDAEPFTPVGIEFGVNGQGAESSLFVQDVQQDLKVAHEKDEATKAVRDCIEAITNHSLPIDLGRKEMRAELSKREYGFGEATVGAALRRMRAAQIEVDDLNMNRNQRPEDVT